MKVYIVAETTRDHQAIAAYVDEQKAKEHLIRLIQEDYDRDKATGGHEFGQYPLRIMTSRHYTSYAVEVTE